MRLQNYLLFEKISQKDIKEGLDNDNIYVGAEFEFICYQMEGNTQDIQDAYEMAQRAWDDWESQYRERKLQEYVSRLSENLICNDRTQIKNPKTNRYLELDIWLPDLNKAIEFNGRCYHNNEETKARDKIKLEECKKNGIDVMVVEEQKWIDNKEEVLYKVEKFIKGE